MYYMTPHLPLQTRGGDAHRPSRLSIVSCAAAIVILVAVENGLLDGAVSAIEQAWLRFLLSVVGGQ